MVVLPPAHLVTALCFAVAAVPIRPDTPWLAGAGLLMVLGGALPRPAGASLVALALPVAAHGGGLPLALWAVSLQWTRSRLTAIPLLALAWYLWWQGPHGLPEPIVGVGILLSAASLWNRARPARADDWLASPPPPSGPAPRHLATEALRASRAWLESALSAQADPRTLTRLAQQVVRLQEDIVDVLEGGRPPDTFAGRTATSLREALEHALTEREPGVAELDVMVAIPPTIDDHVLLDPMTCARLLHTTLRVMARHGRGRALHLRVVPEADALLLRCTWAGRAPADAPPLNHDGAPEDEYLLHRHAHAAGVTVQGVALTQPQPVVELAFAWQPWWRAPERPARPTRIFVQAQDAASSLGVRLDLERLGHIRVMDPAQAQLTISVVPPQAAPLDAWLAALARAGAPAPYLLITPSGACRWDAQDAAPPGTIFLKRPWRLQALREAIGEARPQAQSTPNRPRPPRPRSETET